MRFLLSFVLAALAIIFLSVLTVHRLQASAASPTQADREADFRHKIECSKFLSQLEDAKASNTMGVQELPLQPLVFYSRLRNSCVGITRSMIASKSESYQTASVDDLLTGENIAIKEFHVPGEAVDAGRFVDNEIDREHGLR